MKIHAIYPEAELVLRISVEDTDAPCPVSGMKFGAQKQSWNQILDESQFHNMKIRGVSFHVGSGGVSFENYRNALKDSETLFKLAESKGMPKMDILDIGGGFSTESNYSQNQEYTFDVIAPQIQNYLSNEFPGKKYENVKVIGEPGRQIAQGAQSLCVKVFLAKTQN